MDNYELKNLALVLDFDGTMCRLFKNYNLKDTAYLLRERLRKYGVDFSAEQDAYDAFAEITKQTVGGEEIRRKAYIEADLILTKAETEAVDGALPVNGIDVVLPVLQKSGAVVGVCTNNSERCVEKFLHKLGSNLIFPTVGRVADRPELMKPDTWSLTEVLKKMNAEVENTIFIGDTDRDYACAEKAGCKFIGMAPTERKMKILSGFLPPNRIVSDYFELLEILKVGKA